MYPESYIQDESNHLRSYINSLLNSNAMWVAKIHFIKQLAGKVNYQAAEEIVTGIASLIEEENPTDNPFYYAPNLLMLVCELYELTLILEREYSFLNSYTIRLWERISNIAGEFIQAIDDEDKLRNIVFEKDFEGRDSLHILSQYEITEIMNNKNMEKIALELWYSDYDVKGSILTTSTSYKMLTYNSFNQPWDLVNEYMFYQMKPRRLSNIKHHLYQVNVWKKSISAKVVMEGLFSAAMACVF